MNQQDIWERRKKETKLLFGVMFIPLSVFFIRLGIIYNSKIIEINIHNFYDITLRSLKNEFLIFPKNSEDLKIFLIFSIIYLIFFIQFYENAKKRYMIGKEYGTGEFSKKGSLKKLEDKEDSNNIIFTMYEKFSINMMKTKKNNNILVIGGAGRGKTRYFVLPNLLQAHSSYIVNDLKGSLVELTGTFFKLLGYKVKILNLRDIEKSNRYNPLAYIRKETDVIKLISTLIKNTTPPNSNTSDPFWEKAETALLQSLIFFTWLFLDESECNFSTVMKLLLMGESTGNEKTDLDLLMEKYDKKYPNNIACKQYKIFKQAPEKTANSILISTSVRLSVFNIESVEKLTSIDEFSLGKIGNERTIVFLITSETDSSLNFLISLFYTQLFDQLIYTADFEDNTTYGITLKKYRQTLDLYYEEKECKKEKIYKIKKEKKHDDSYKLIKKIFGKDFIEEIEDEIKKEITNEKKDNLKGEILVNYFDIITGEEIRSSEIISGIAGQDISLYDKDIPGYIFKEAFLNNIKMNRKNRVTKFPVRCILDEFVNGGIIPEFEKVLATIRERDISASILIQNIGQIKNLYKDSYSTIIGNCSSLLYLGGREEESHKYISESLGKMTIDSKSYGKTKGKKGGLSVNEQKMGREVMTSDEVGTKIDDNSCILFIDGIRPFFSKKYDLKKHKNYKYLSECNPNFKCDLNYFLRSDDIKVDLNKKN